MNEFAQTRREAALTTLAELRRAGSTFDSGARRLQRIAEALRRRLVAWRGSRRRSAELARLDDATLKDIGLSRGDLPGIVRSGLDPRPLAARRYPTPRLVAASATPPPRHPVARNLGGVTRPARPVLAAQTGVSTPISHRRAS
jgi:uncharacterized protein YjiS (DUF1127 family)